MVERHHDRQPIPASRGTGGHAMSLEIEVGLRDREGQCEPDNLESLDRLPEARSDAALPPRYRVLGVDVSIVTLETAIDVLELWIVSGRREFVCVRDIHGVILCQDDANLALIHQQAGMVLPDGSPLVWIGRLKGLPVGRTCGPDLLPAVCARSIVTGHSHFFFGGAPGIAQRLRASLEERYPGLKVIGAATPPYRPLSDVEEERFIAEMNGLQPDILWIGLSTPKQEEFMARMVGRLDVPVMIGVGAAFDIHAGTVARAPHLLQVVGCEWLWRLLQEPRRLGRRYCNTIPRFVSLVILQMIGVRRQNVADVE